MLWYDNVWACVFRRKVGACRPSSSMMEDQANRPHRKTKEKKKHTGGTSEHTLLSFL